MTAYATGADLVDRYDIDLISDLATDRETVSRDEIVDHPRVSVALADASGEVEVAMLAGGRYTVEQLSSLTGNSVSHLKQIVCGLAVAALARRRPEAYEREYIEAITKDARQAILSLRRGENLFGLTETIESSVPEITGPSSINIQSRNDLSSRMERFFPAAAQRLPRGQ